MKTEKNNAIEKTQYISLLPESTQQAIESDLKVHLSQLDLTPAAQQEALQNALESRLCDLSDIINIHKYLN